MHCTFCTLQKKFVQNKQKKKKSFVISRTALPPTAAGKKQLPELSIVGRIYSYWPATVNTSRSRYSLNYHKIMCIALHLLLHSAHCSALSFYCTYHIQHSIALPFHTAITWGSGGEAQALGVSDWGPCKVDPCFLKVVLLTSYPRWPHPAKVSVFLDIYTREAFAGK